MAKQTKGFRKDKAAQALEGIRSTLTDEELHRIDETRRFDGITEGSLTYKLVLRQDQLRIALRKEQLQIGKMIWNIGNLANQLFRARLQLETGNIIETIGEGIVMTEEELKTHIQYMEWTQSGEHNGIYAGLMQVRGVVGHYDVEKNMILTEVEFDEYINEINEKLEKAGFKLF